MIEPQCFAFNSPIVSPDTPRCNGRDRDAAPGPLYRQPERKEKGSIFKFVTGIVSTGGALVV